MEGGVEAPDRGDLGADHPGRGDVCFDAPVCGRGCHAVHRGQLVVVALPQASECLLDVSFHSSGVRLGRLRRQADDAVQRVKGGGAANLLKLRQRSDRGGAGNGSYHGPIALLVDEALVPRFGKDQGIRDDARRGGSVRAPPVGEE